VRPRLIEGDRGIFDVAVDGEVIFSKHRSGRFPAHSEIVELLRDRMA